MTFLDLNLTLLGLSLKAYILAVCVCSVLRILLTELYQCLYNEELRAQLNLMYHCIFYDKFYGLFPC